MKRIRKILLRVVIWFLISLFILIGLGLLLGYIYQEEIKQLFIKELNKKLNTEIQAKKIHFSLIKKFPYAAVSLLEVNAKEVTNASKKDNLIEAKAIHLQFNLFDIFDKKLNLQRIEIANGTINIKIFKDGSDNYHFWKEDSTAQSENFSMDLKKIILNKVQLNYSDQKHQLAFGYFFDKGILKISVKNEKQQVIADADGELTQFNMNNKNSIPDANLNMDLELFTQDSWNSIKIKKSDIKYGNLPVMTVNADFNHLVDGKTTTMELHSNMKNIKIQQLLATFFDKNKLHPFFADMHALVNLECMISGEISKTKIPEIKINFDLSDANFTEKSRFEDIQQLYAKGYYCNKYQEKENDFLAVSSFNFKIFKEEINGNFKMLNFSKPTIETAFKGKIQMMQILKMLNNPDFKMAEGIVLFDILFSGTFRKFPEISNQDFQQSNIQGTVSVENIAFPVKQQLVLRNGNAKFRFNNTHLYTDKFTGEYGNTKFELNGYFKNLFANLFTTDKQVIVDCNFKTDHLNITDFIKNDSNSKSSHIALPDDVIFKLNANIKALQFNNFNATDISGVLRYKNKQLFAENIKANSLDGSVMLSGIVDGSNGNKFVIQSQSALTHINMEKLFKVMQNFNQQHITSQHIRGFANIKLSFNSEWNKQLQADLNKLAINADISIDNGELIKLQLLQKLSRFIKVEDLQHIYFKQLNNQIQIFDKKIVIPEMHIQSNAIDFWISGTHYFDNRIDYNLRVLLSDLLFNKAKKNKKDNEEFGIIEDDGNGKTSLYIKITGTADNPHFSYNRKAVAKKIMDDIKKEQQNIKNILKKEFFSWTQKDSLQQQKDKHQQKLQEEGKFVIEWDEE